MTESPRRDANLVVGGVLGAVAGALLDALGLPQIGVLSDPIILIGFTAVVGGAVGFLNAPSIRWLAFLDAAGLAACAVLAFTPISARLAEGWIRRDPPSNSPPDAVIVLSDGLNLDGTLSPGGVDRLLHGIELFRTDRAAVLATTRIEFGWAGRHASSDEDHRRIVLASVPAAAWIELPTVRSTRDEALRAAEVLIPRQMRRVAVVTSPLHSRRACAAFEHVQFVVACRPAHDRVHMTQAPVMPSDRLAAWRSYLYERLATWKYRRRGWIASG